MALMTATDWWITGHAARRMVERGFTREQLLDCASDPEVSYRGSAYCGTTRRVCQKGEVAVVVNDETEEIITVLLRKVEPWGEQVVTVIDGAGE